ncbi:MAG: hypothetical protein A4S09_05660 [Proteobacteria bacterium SG_bin7]|nr:MAG: hypothetical protein A4S09_05660 [Proteobacteria bacterium SG_bin7]
MEKGTDKRSAGYNFGDTWCSGGFTLGEISNICEIILSNYDVPAWPELLCFGENETLDGFWTQLYTQWLNPEGPRVQLDEAVAKRPGIKLFHSRFSGSPLNLIKGQMIGPATLKWCLQKNKISMGSNDHLVNFVVEAAIAQIQILSKIAWNVVLCFDEPSASFVPEVESLWRDVIVSLDKYRPYGIALHSCGEFKAQWLEWPWQVVHFDVNECVNFSAKHPKDWRESFEKYFNRGSWLVSGVLSSSALAIEAFDPLLLNDFFDTVKGISNNQIMFSSTCGIDCKSETALVQRLGEFGKISELSKKINVKQLL